MGFHLLILITVPILSLTSIQYVETQSGEDFNCTFSGCVGENVVCYCSVQNGVIRWWDDDATFCCITMLYNSMERNDPDQARYRVEVVNGSTRPTGAFTSKLTLNVSTELNDTEIGCTSSQLNFCRPSNSDQNSFTLLVKDCPEMSAPTPPLSNLSLAGEKDAQCNSSAQNNSLSCETSPSQVTSCNISCTSADGEGSCMAVKVVNEISSEDSATIWLQVGNITSNLTIRYGPCSEPSLSCTTVPFMTPVIQLVNLTAETTYCYSINVTDTASDATVGSCYGTFTTAADATTAAEVTTAAEATTSPTMPAAIQPYETTNTIQTPSNIGEVIGALVVIAITTVTTIIVIIFCGSCQCGMRCKWN